MNNFKSWKLLFSPVVQQWFIYLWHKVSFSILTNWKMSHCSFSWFSTFPQILPHPRPQEQLMSRVGLGKSPNIQCMFYWLYNYGMDIDIADVSSHFITFLFILMVIVTCHFPLKHSYYTWNKTFFRIDKSSRDCLALGNSCEFLLYGILRTP